MDDLTYSLRVLCQRNRDGSHATQADRLGSLTLCSRQLREAGFRQMQARSLKGKHVQVLLERWKAEGLSAGTLKNRVAHLRWWAEKVGKAGLIPAGNTELAIPKRQFVTNEDKSRRLGSELVRPSTGRGHQVSAELCGSHDSHFAEGLVDKRRARTGGADYIA